VEICEQHKLIILFAGLGIFTGKVGIRKRRTALGAACETVQVFLAAF
jgi:hypothetical protein